MIWIVFALMTAAALAALVWPLARARRGQDDRAGVALYEAQIAQLRRDAAAGALSEADAQAAEREAARRLIADSRVAAPLKTSARRRFGAAALAIGAVAACGLLYLRVGSPDVRDLPLAARQTPKSDFDLASALAQIEAHLRDSPDDARGWAVVAPVYLRLGRAEDAARAYANVLRLRGDDAGARADFAEALVYVAQGVVTADAKASFEQALAKDARQAKARFYLGLAAAQDGDAPAARAIWSSLAADAEPGSPLRKTLDERLAALGAPTAADEVAALDPAAQSAAIRGMVDKLAARLHENGHDIEGWLKLVRAWRVLNDAERARQALVEARGQFRADAAATARLDALARELGIEG